MIRPDSDREHGPLFRYRPALAFTVLNGWAAESNDKIAFWIWVLAAYLVSLIVEMVLLVRRLPPLKLASSAEPTGATETGKG